MAAITGVTGAVTITGDSSEVAVNVSSWNATITNDEHVADTFDGSLKGHTIIPGMYTMRGQISGFTDGDSAFLVLASLDPDRTVTVIVLTSSTGRVYTLNGHVMDVSPTASKSGGLGTYTASFVSSGDITSIV